jgi:hypothetical protein
VINIDVLIASSYYEMLILKAITIEIMLLLRLTLMLSVVIIYSAITFAITDTVVLKLLI